MSTARGYELRVGDPGPGIEFLEGPGASGVRLGLHPQCGDQGYLDLSWSSSELGPRSCRVRALAADMLEVGGTLVDLRSATNLQPAAPTRALVPVGAEDPLLYEPGAEPSLDLERWEGALPDGRALVVRTYRTRQVADTAVVVRADHLPWSGRSNSGIGSSWGGEGLRELRLEADGTSLTLSFDHSAGRAQGPLVRAKQVVAAVELVRTEQATWSPPASDLAPVASGS